MLGCFFIYNTTFDTHKPNETYLTLLVVLFDLPEKNPDG